MNSFRYIFFSLLIFLFLGLKNRPGHEKIFYDTAIIYLKSKYPKGYLQTLRTDCEKLTNQVSAKNFKGFQISNTTIGNSSGLVLCDVIKRIYKSDSCGELLAGNSFFVKRIRDSVNVQIDRQLEFDKTNDAHSYIKSIASTKEIGLVIFFSSVFENTLSAEVKEFCTSYKSDKNWQGSSDMYHFIFYPSGEIKEVFQGKKFYN
jgi:hypothetical protein